MLAAGTDGVGRCTTSGSPRIAATAPVARPTLRYRARMRVSFPVDEPTMRALERHETLAHALPRREVRDLGDALLLVDALDPEPFWNRLVSVRWPSGPAAFDARLADAIALFGILDRRPHVWPSPAYNRPDDLVRRLLAFGFRDVGGGHLMVLTDDAAAPPVRDAELGRGVTLELVHGTHDPGPPSVAAAGVLAEAFDAAPGREHELAGDLARGLADARVALVIARVEGVAAAVAKATTFEGATYLSSIGTRQAFRGRRLAELATRAAIAHGRARGASIAYLGVFSGNVSALRLYERLGFATIGESPDLVLG
jgi:GNAT superfamily N-acetyltransferase